MDRPTIYDFIESRAKFGHTSLSLNLYPKQEQDLVRNGFSVQRIASVIGHPQQHRCNVDWAHPSKCTTAYRMLELAAEVHPELMYP